ncbi:Cyclic nucleotide-binding protein [Pseudocohnilembus persalinus]|uniref:Cyclic nucleotide-binding protein n=1 Tax=Pseudocohnilembus persalinus TaxID=266149 RepID=A0A0V0R2S1_PSEPJ|nr:Cyclic nucleotide-binding protein [Pseudocohnilembus persalinus]|eukprot:KRX08802.1 Cyclic nucleotide-binding protein [Pseudocohnilembus persalinus]
MQSNSNQQDLENNETQTINQKGEKRSNKTIIEEDGQQTKYKEKDKNQILKLAIEDYVDELNQNNKEDNQIYSSLRQTSLSNQCSNSPQNLLSSNFNYDLNTSIDYFAENGYDNIPEYIEKRQSSSRLFINSKIMNLSKIRPEDSKSKLLMKGLNSSYCKSQTQSQTIQQDKTNWGIVMQANIIKKYYTKMKQQTMESNFHRLTEYHFNLIKDNTHLTGCGFYLISRLDSEKGYRTWITVYNENNQTWLEQYINSLYFSVITMITVGYGDIVPISKNEKVYVLIVTLLSSAMFGYSVNTIGQIFSEIERKNAKFKQQKYDLTNYMRTRQISTPIQRRVFKYLDFLKFKEEEAPEKFTNILNMMSSQLRNEVKIDFYGRILGEQKIFYANFSKEFLRELSLSMREIIFGPGEIVYQQGEGKNLNFYYILKGEMQSVYKGQNQQLQEQYILQNLQVGQIFGQREFFSQEKRKENMQSLTKSYLLYLKYSDFQQIIQSYPTDYDSQFTDGQYSSEEDVIGENEQSLELYLQSPEKEIKIEDTDNLNSIEENFQEEFPENIEIINKIQTKLYKQYSFNEMQIKNLQKLQNSQLNMKGEAENDIKLNVSKSQIINRQKNNSQDIKKYRNSLKQKQAYRQSKVSLMYSNENMKNIIKDLQQINEKQQQKKGFLEMLEKIKKSQQILQISNSSSSVLSMGDITSSQSDSNTSNTSESSLSYQSQKKQYGQQNIQQQNDLQNKIQKVEINDRKIQTKQTKDNIDFINSNSFSNSENYESSESSSLQENSISFMEKSLQNQNLEQVIELNELGCDMENEDKINNNSQQNQIQQKKQKKNSNFQQLLFKNQGYTIKLIKRISQMVPGMQVNLQDEKQKQNQDFYSEQFKNKNDNQNNLKLKENYQNDQKFDSYNRQLSKFAQNLQQNERVKIKTDIDKDQNTNHNNSQQSQGLLNPFCSFSNNNKQQIYAEQNINKEQENQRNFQEKIWLKDLIETKFNDIIGLWSQDLNKNKLFLQQEIQKQSQDLKNFYNNTKFPKSQIQSNTNIQYLDNNNNSYIQSYQPASRQQVLELQLEKLDFQNDEVVKGLKKYEFFIKDFDMMKIFKQYFNHNNYDLFRIGRILPTTLIIQTTL